MPYNRIRAIVGGKEKVVTSVDVYKEIRRLQLEGVASQRAAAKRLGIFRNTVKKYWEGNAVPWDRKEYSRDAAVMTPEVVQFISSCLDEDDRIAGTGYPLLFYWGIILVYRHIDL